MGTHLRINFYLYLHAFAIKTSTHPPPFYPFINQPDHPLKSDISPNLLNPSPLLIL